MTLKLESLTVFVQRSVFSETCPAKTSHTLNYIDDENRSRVILSQLNRGEERHSLARDVFHGKRGELYQGYW